MKNIRRVFDVRLVCGVIRSLFYKVFYTRVNMKGYRNFIDRNVRLINKRGKLELHGKNWINRNCKIQADGGQIDIGFNTFINEYCYVISKKSITIGDNCIIGPGVMIYDHDHQYKDTSLLINRQGFKCREINIGDNVWIGANVFIAKGVNIGRHSVIAANSVVVKNVEKFSVVGGNPANLIKYI